MTPPPDIGTPIASVLLLAGALLVADGRPGRGRLGALGDLRGIHGPARTSTVADGRPAPVLRRAWVVVAAAAAAAVGWTVAGAAAGVVAGGATGLVGGLAARLAAPRVGPPRTEDGDLARGWELIAVCLEAGLPVAVAVSAATEPLPGGAGTALRRVAGLLALGADPAEAWATAGGDVALAAFARAAGRSAGTGAALAGAARAEAARLRSRLLDSAQARAQRAGVLIAGPLGLCFLPAFLVLGVAPVVVGLARQALAQW